MSEKPFYHATGHVVRQFHCQSTTKDLNVADGFQRIYPCANTGYLVDNPNHWCANKKCVAMRIFALDPRQQHPCSHY